MIQPFHLVSHFKGVGDSIDSVLLGSTGYTDFDNVYAPGSYATPLRSYVTWKDAKNPASPTDRWLRFKYPTFFSFLLTVKPTAANWQSRLTRIEVGSQRWLRPSHVHCVQNFTPLSGSAGSGPCDTNLTVTDPSGNPIPDAIVVCRRRTLSYTFVPSADPTFPIWEDLGWDAGTYSTTVTSDTSVIVQANGSGVATNVLQADFEFDAKAGVFPQNSNPIRFFVMYLYPSFDTITVYDPNRAWRGVEDIGAHPGSDSSTSLKLSSSITPGYRFYTPPASPVPPGTSFSGAQSRAISTYLPTSAPTGKIDQEVWPQDTFTALGTAYVAGGKDWMPPIVIEAINESGYGYGEATQPFPCECDLTMLRINNFRHTGSGGFMGEFANLDAPPRTNTPAGSSPFAFGRHSALPPGLYWKKSTYPATYASPTTRWESPPVSDATGYTPPTTEPSCDFVVKEGDS